MKRINLSMFSTKIKYKFLLTSCILLFLFNNESISQIKKYDLIYLEALELILRDWKNVENFENSFCIPDTMFTSVDKFFVDYINNSKDYLGAYIDDEYIDTYVKTESYDTLLIYKPSDTLFKDFENCDDKKYRILFGRTDGYFLNAFVEKADNREYFRNDPIEVYLFIFSGQKLQEFFGEMKLIHFFKGTIVY